MPPQGFTETLRGLMARRGVCLRGLARQVPIDAGQLSRVLNGKPSPTDELAQRTSGTATLDRLEDMADAMAMAYAGTAPEQRRSGTRLPRGSLAPRSMSWSASRVGCLALGGSLRLGSISTMSCFCSAVKTFSISLTWINGTTTSW